MTIGRFRSALFAGVVSLSAVSAQAVTIQLRNTGGVEAGTDAFKGFTMAAKFWEKVLTDNVTIKLNVGYNALPANVLGSTGSTTNGIYLDSYRAYLANDKTSILDNTAVANLTPMRASTSDPGRGAVDAIIPAAKANGTGVNTAPLSRVWDADGSRNNTAISMNTSLMKAIGLTPIYTGNNAAIQADGSITFSTGFASSFDFDPTNGITAGKFDFVGIAIHEIGHALGFRSGVDVYDTNTNFAGNLNGQIFMTQLDQFRYSANPTNLGGVGPKLDWGIGGTGAAAPYFSIDGGATALFGNTFSTGSNFGDGRQASHWKDSAPGLPQLGLLDPTAARGQQGIITGLDLAAYDAIGWDIAYNVLGNPNKQFSTKFINFSAIPEPSNWAMLIAGFGLTGAVMRRRRVAGASAA